MSSGLPAGLPQLTIQAGPGDSYPSAQLVNCTVELGVVTLALAHINLTGSLESVDLTPLASSLTVLDLGGTALADQMQAPSQALHEDLRVMCCQGTC